MCSLTSPYKSTIEKHVAAVHDGIRFFCKHCIKLFKQDYYFTDHMKTHEPGYVDTSYKCDFCSKSFKTKHILKMHVKMHNAERDFFVCDVCGKKFTERGYFKTHMRTPGRSRTCVISATRDSRWRSTSRLTCVSILKKNRTVVTFARRVSPKKGV
jgi:uncharacterized Zn-finger protein